MPDYPFLRTILDPSLAVRYTINMRAALMSHSDNPSSRMTIMWNWTKSLFSSSPKPTVQTENVGNVFAELDASLAAYRRGEDGRNDTAAGIHDITSDSSTSRAKVGALWTLIWQTKDPKTAEDKWITLNMPAVFVDAYRKNSEQVSWALISAASSHVGGEDSRAVRLINKLYAPESANV